MSVSEQLFETMEQSKARVDFEYEFHLSKVCGPGINKVFDEDVASERTVRRWFEKFRSGAFNHESVPREGNLCPRWITMN